MPSFLCSNSSAGDVLIRDQGDPGDPAKVVAAGAVNVLITCALRSKAAYLTMLAEAASTVSGFTYSLASDEAQVSDAQGLGSVFSIRKAFTAGTPGSAGDIVIYDGSTTKLPFGIRILDFVLVVLTNIAGKTVTLRSAAAGAGSALSDALSGASAGTVREAAKTTTSTVAAGAGLWARTTDIGLAGEIIIYCERTS